MTRSPGVRRRRADPHEVLLEPPAVDHPVHGGGRDQQRGGGGAQHEGDDVDDALEVGDGREAGLEGQREQEREQDLDAGLCHPHFLQYLAVSPVGSLHGRLAARPGVPVVVIMNRTQHRTSPPRSREF